VDWLTETTSNRVTLVLEEHKKTVQWRFVSIRKTLSFLRHNEIVLAN